MYFGWYNTLQIQPEQVMEANQPGPLFMIIECPAVDYIPSLVTNKQLNQLWEENSHVTPAVIVHLTPMIVFENEEYKQWRERQVKPYGPKSDQHQFSPNNISRSSREKVMRITKLIIKGRLL